MSVSFVKQAPKAPASPETGIQPEMPRTIKVIAGISAIAIVSAIGWEAYMTDNASRLSCTRQTTELTNIGSSTLPFTDIDGKTSFMLQVESNENSRLEVYVFNADDPNDGHSYYTRANPPQQEISMPLKDMTAQVVIDWQSKSLAVDC